MALFGKKEEGKASGVQAPPTSKIVPREQKKNLPKGKENTKANKASKQTTYLGVSWRQFKFQARFQKNED